MDGFRFSSSLLNTGKAYRYYHWMMYSSIVVISAGLDPTQMNIQIINSRHSYIQVDYSHDFFKGGHGALARSDRSPLPDHNGCLTLFLTPVKIVIPRYDGRHMLSERTRAFPETWGAKPVRKCGVSILMNQKVLPLAGPYQVFWVRSLFDTTKKKAIFLSDKVELRENKLIIVDNTSNYKQSE